MRFLRAYFGTVFLARRWILSLVSALVGYIAQIWYRWFAPLPANINLITIWKPSAGSITFSLVLGLAARGETGCFRATTIII
jgi:hypothetical protein